MTAMDLIMMSSATAPILRSWTQQTLPASLNWESIAYGANLFVAIAAASATYVTSPDGVSWTQRTLPTNGSFNTIIYANGNFVIVGASTITLISTDGITWRSGTIQSSDWRCIAYGANIYVCIDSGTSAYATSSDGITWTRRSSGFVSGVTSIGYRDNGQTSGFVGVSLPYRATTPLFVVSSDGINWSYANAPVYGASYSVAYLPSYDIFVFPAYGGSGITITTDATSSTHVIVPQDPFPNSVNVNGWAAAGFGAGHIAIVGSNLNFTTMTCAAISSDGVNWTRSTLPMGNWQGVAWGNGVFCACGDGSTVATFNQTRFP